MINSDDFTAQNIVYYDAYDKQKNATVSIAADVTYNNVAFPYYTAADFIIKNGKLVLIDMDKDKVYDTVKIIAYTDALVNAATEADKRVITSTGTYVLEDYDSYEIVDVYGNPAEFSQLTAKTPVSVVVSKDKKTYVKIIICNDYKVSGMVESQSDSDGLTWTVSGKTADASLKLIEKINKKEKTAPSVGENYVMYVNANGKALEYFTHEVWGANGEKIYWVSSKGSPTPSTEGLVRANKDGTDREYINRDYLYWHCFPSGNDKWIVGDTASGQVVLVNTSSKKSYYLAKFGMSNWSHPYQPHPAVSYNANSVCWQLDYNGVLSIAWQDTSDITK